MSNGETIEYLGKKYIVVQDYLSNYDKPNSDTVIVSDLDNKNYYLYTVYYATSFDIKHWPFSKTEIDFDTQLVLVLDSFNDGWYSFSEIYGLNLIHSLTKE